MKRSNKQHAVFVNAPLIQGQHAHNAFFRVLFQKKQETCRYVATETGQDKDVFPLQDYGYYVAGVEAKKAYLNLMRYWRNRSPVPNWLLSPAKNWTMDMNCGLADTTIFDNRSSQLALLLGMIASQQKLPVKEIFATGELDNDERLPRVKAVGGLSQKINSILDHIGKEQPLHPILIALPSQIDPQKGTAIDNQTEVNYSRRIESFCRQHKRLNIKVIYCDHLLDDLTQAFPHIGDYPHPARYLKWLPVAALSLFAWHQYQQQLYLNWDNAAYSSEANRPLRGRLQADNKVNIVPLCPESRLGEDVFGQGDLIIFNVKSDDYSLWRGLTSIHTALVMVGEKSGVRVENLPPSATFENLYQIAFALDPPGENYLVSAIAQKSFAIDKGALNSRLAQLVSDKQGIERLTTAAGFLDQHFNHLSYRFRMLDQPCGEML